MRHLSTVWYSVRNCGSGAGTGTGADAIMTWRTGAAITACRSEELSAIALDKVESLPRKPAPASCWHQNPLQRARTRPTFCCIDMAALCICMDTGACAGLLMSGRRISNSIHFTHRITPCQCSYLAEHPHSVGKTMLRRKFLT